MAEPEMLEYRGRW